MVTNFITEYNDKLQSGEIPASRRIKAVYSRLSAGTQNSSGRYTFDLEKANKTIHFIETYCKHSKGPLAGQPMRLELFQRAYLQALFGFVDRETGLRRFRESLFLVGRKNGKTSLMAGLSLYMLMADGEAGAEVYTAATVHAQSKILFDETLAMVKQSPKLAQYLKKRKEDLWYEIKNSKMKPLCGKAGSLDGLNASFVVIDELHGVKDMELYHVLQQSQTARTQPLLVMITTAGTVRQSIYDDRYEYACKVADGQIDDPRFLPLLYELDDRSEWQNPKAWVKANPGLGVIKQTEALAAKVEAAKTNPHELTALLTKDLNVRENVSSAWLSFDELNNDEHFSLEDFRGSYCIGGVDLSITTDLTAASLLFMRSRDDRKYVSQMFWLPADTLKEHIERDKVPYDKWINRGLLRLCDGGTISYHDVSAWFLEMVQTYQLYPAWVYYDSYSSRYFVDEMKSYGFTMIRCIQGAKTLSIPMQLLGSDLRAHKVVYNGNPILKWCLSNTAIQTDRNGNIVPIKARAGKNLHIDGLAALLDCYVGLYEHMSEFTGVVSK